METLSDLAELETFQHWKSARGRCKCPSPLDFWLSGSCWVWLGMLVSTCCIWGLAARLEGNGSPCLSRGLSRSSSAAAALCFSSSAIEQSLVGTLSLPLAFAAGTSSAFQRTQRSRPLGWPAAPWAIWCSLPGCMITFRAVYLRLDLAALLSDQLVFPWPPWSHCGAR